MAVIADRYELREQLGTGGTATVWRAWDSRLHRIVAVKLLSRVLAAEPNFVARFEREARHAAGLSHPNIVTIFDFGTEDDTAYLVMELVEGESLAQRLRRLHRLDIADTVTIVTGILSGVAEAHRQGIIHRDIKPSNILLGVGEVVKVADFGIARASDDHTQLTDTGVLMGTVGYLSPEQCAGQSATGRSDLYSVGCLTYECLVGRPPFTGESPASVMYQHQHAGHEPISNLRTDVPPALEAAVDRALEKNPANRFSSASEMGRELLRSVDAGASAQRAPFGIVMPESTEAITRTAAFGLAPPNRTPPRKRRRWYIGAGLAVIVAVALIASLLLANNHGVLTAARHRPKSSATSTTAVTGTTTPSPTSVAEIESVSLPVVTCPTTYATPTPVAAPPPSSITLNVPSDLAGSLAIYSDENGTMKLVGPKGWQCSAHYGGDGGGGVEVFPTGEQPPTGSAFSPQEEEAIVGSQTSACLSCREMQACPLFSTATTDYLNDYQMNCPETRPPDESTDQISAGVIGFEDPAGVAGDGNPSGGPYPANGVMTYYSGNENGSWLDTCTLPNSDHALCTVALNAFINFYGSD